MIKTRYLWPFRLAKCKGVWANIMPAARELYDLISSGRLVMISSTVSSLIVTTIINVVSGKEKSTVDKNISTPKISMTEYKNKTLLVKT